MSVGRWIRAKVVEKSKLTFIEDSFRTGRTTESLDCVPPIKSGTNLSSGECGRRQDGWAWDLRYSVSNTGYDTEHRAVQLLHKPTKR